MRILIKNFRIIDHEINIKFKVITKTIDARIKKQNKKFANICFAKIIIFVKNNIILTE